ncbi:MAG: hypothetical protein U0271_19835 [Polyangiaceae bacterium]
MRHAEKPANQPLPNGNARTPRGVRLTMVAWLDILGRSLALTAVCGVAACSRPADSAEKGSASTDSTSTSAAGTSTSPTAEKSPAVEQGDPDFDACETEWKASEGKGRKFGEGPVEEHRSWFLGRARGAVALFVRPPVLASGEGDKKLADEVKRFQGDAAGYRVTKLLGRNKNNKAFARAVLLREGYLYAEDPDDAYELESRVHLTDLFDEQDLTLEHGAETIRLTRNQTKGQETRYDFAEGPNKGKKAQIVFGDRITVAGTTTGPALHRDLLSLSWLEGFERAEILSFGESRILAKLRYGSTWAKAVIDSEGAKLSLRCLAEPRTTRDVVATYLKDTAWRRRALARLRDAVGAQVEEALPFDRPRDEKGPDKDGWLRPHWLSAYMMGRTSFAVENQIYPVFFPDGRPSTPQVCVDFVLDSFERAAGSWYVPQGQKPERVAGRLDLSSYGIVNRRGVLGFFAFAEEHPELFETKKFKGPERIQFAKRKEFFAYLTEHADEIRSGDVLAIQGMKRDNRIHQHAILLEYVDPLTGFPSGLADQMKLPRRRSWEGIMAEAPARALLYWSHPKEVILRPLDDGAEPTAPTVLASQKTP